MAEPRLRIRVDCYEGYRGEETPRRLRIGECRIEVSEIIDRWLSPEHRYFKLRGDDGGIYIVLHDHTGSFWELTFFDSGRAPVDRLSST